MDESTDTFRAFSAAMVASAVLGPATLQAALKVSDRYEIDLAPADDVFKNAEDASNWGEDMAAGFRVLEAVMRATLTDLSIAFARAEGVVRVRMWLFGRAPDGSLVGLRSEVTET